MQMTPLETGQIWVLRIHAAAIALVLLAAAGIGETFLRDRFGSPYGVLVLPLLLPLAWLVLLAPRRRWRAWAYARSERDLQLRHGVWTRVHTLVPLDRVQHIDISQGPIERGCGVCRLVLHTAGTLHSRVVLPGLSRATAETMRDEIRAQIRSDS